MEKYTGKYLSVVILELVAMGEDLQALGCGDQGEGRDCS